MASQSQSTEARRAERRQTEAPSTLRTDHGGPLDAIVSDISITGARIACDVELRVGQEVTVGVASVGAVRGLIMWRRDDSYGVAFAQPLDEEAAARAFAAPTVVRLMARHRNADLSPPPVMADEESSLYAEGTGWLSALVVTVVFVAGLGAVILHHFA